MTAKTINDLDSFGLYDSITKTSRFAPGDPVRFEHDGNNVRGVIDALRDAVVLAGNPGPAREYVLLGTHDKDAYRLGKGCSGTVVMSEGSKTIVGMIHAGETGTGAGYITPIHVIIEDIESRTGRKVRMPVLDDYPERALG